MQPVTRPRQTAPATAAEARLRAAASGTRDVSITDLTGDESVIRAEFLRDLLLTPSPTHPAVTLEGGHIDGPLDLEGCVVPNAVKITGARFTDAVRLTRASLPRLELAHCLIPALAAARADIRHSLTLKGSSFPKGIVLDGATMPGGLDCRGVSVANPDGHGLSFADGAAGLVWLSDGFSSLSGVLLRRTRIGGQLNCRRASFRPRGDVAIDATWIEAGEVLLVDVRAVGEVRFDSSTVGNVLCTGDFSRPGSDAISFASARAHAVHLGGADARLRVTGGIDVSGANLGRLSLSHGTVSNSGELAVSFMGTTAAQNVLIDHCSVTGQVSFDRARIEGLLHLRACEIRNDPGSALTAVSTTAGMITVAETTCSGVSAFVHIEVATRCSFWDSTFTAPDDGALVITESAIAGGLDLERLTIRGGLILRDTTVVALIDDLGGGEDHLGSWSGADPLILEGFAYRSFGEGTDCEGSSRVEWLRRTSWYQPGAWRTLVEAHRASGRDREARLTAIAGQDDRLRRGHLSVLQKAALGVLRVTIGYGYRPWLAGAWAIVVITAFAAIVSRHPDSLVATGTSAGRPAAVAYAADRFLPIIDLGQASQWTAVGWVAWVEWSVVLLGWALTTLFVAGYTRVVRN